MRDRNDTTKTIKQALKNRSGKDWSVTGGRGTGWGWLRIEAPKARRVRHLPNPEYVNPWETPDTPAWFEEPAVGAEAEFGYMSREDCQELADLLGFDRPVHHQGHSISPDEWEFIVERALNDKPAPEPEADPIVWIVADPDHSLIQPVLTDISAANLFVTARFAKLNKNCSLAEYQHEVGKGKDSYRDERCKVTEIAALTDEGFDAFADSLLDPFEWLAGKGGSDAPGEWPQVNSWSDLSDAQQTLWRKTCYNLVVAVTAPNRETIYVNPEGHSYARYVGI